MASVGAGLANVASNKQTNNKNKPQTSFMAIKRQLRMIVGKEEVFFSSSSKCVMNERPYVTVTDPDT